MRKLTTRKVATLKEPGLYGDGGCLYLAVGEGNAKSWVLRTMVHGKRRDYGLGSASLVTLAEARELALTLRKVARQGGDPAQHLKKESPTFEEATRSVHGKLVPTFSSKGHGERWIASMEHYVFPKLGKRPIEQIQRPEVLEVLTEIWVSKHDTATRIKQRISVVFDWAKHAGHYSAENPVNGIQRALPTIRRRAEHMPALEWRKMPAFMTELAKREGTSARCLEFIIHTLARSGEARLARWSEIHDIVWLVPPERMKGKTMHRVPLSSGALAAVRKMEGVGHKLIFPSSHAGHTEEKPLSDTVFKALMARMGYHEITTHGFRSTFRDWCSEYAKAEREVAEAALAHAYGDKVERAYARSDVFERRGDLMVKWSRFLAGEEGEDANLAR